MHIRNPKFLAVSALCGAIGVLSGYAIFLTYHQVSIAPAADHARARFALTLLITAVVSFLIEWIRELIREGRIEHATHPFFRTMGTFVIVLMFELFVLGFHTTSDLSLKDLSGAATQLLGPNADTSATWTLLLAAGTWIAVGALLAAWLSQFIPETPAAGFMRIAIAGGKGIAGGLIFAPLVMALYILGGRCLFALIQLFHDFGGNNHGNYFLNPLPILWHNIWLSQYVTPGQWLPKLFVFLIALPFGLLVMAAQKNIWLFLALFLAFAAFVVSYPFWRKARLIRHPLFQISFAATWLLLLIFTAGPFGYAMFEVVKQLAHLDPIIQLLKIVALAAFLWGVPGLLLGGLTPLLHRVSAHTRNWAFVGYGAAVLLIAATLLAHAWWPLVPAIAAAAVGYMFQRGSSVYEYWPFAALCVAAGICGATSLTQQLTFTHEVANLHAIDTLRPAHASEPTLAGLMRNYDTLTPTEQAQLLHSHYTEIAIIRGDNGQLQGVPVIIPDDQTLKAIQKAIAENQPAMDKMLADEEAAQQKAIDAAIAAQQKLIAQSLDPALERAVAQANQPDNAKPAPKLKKPAPPATDTNDNPALKGFGNPLLPQSPDQNPSPDHPKTPSPAATPAPAAAPAAAAPPSTANNSTPAPTAQITNQPATDTTASATEEENRAAEALELSISGSVGFWVTVGLLACWSMQESDSHEPAA